MSTVNYNVDIVGNLTNNNGILSGFSSSNYAKWSQVPADTSVFEVGICFITSATTVTGGQQIFSLGDGSEASESCPLLVWMNNGGTFFYGKNARNQNIGGTDLTGIDIQNNTKYYVKFVSDGSNISLYYSTTGFDNMTLHGSREVIAIGGSIYFGYSPEALTTKGAFAGSIDLNNCYIKVNNKQIWNGVTKQTERNGIDIQLRHDTASNWMSVSPVLLEGEVGIETDTNKIKIGDGANQWNDLSYFGDIVHITETYSNRTSGYVIWSNGFTIQWGSIDSRSSNSWVTVTLLKSFSTPNYNVTLAITGTGEAQESQALKDKTNNSFKVYGWNGRGNDWCACGYI